MTAEPYAAALLAQICREIQEIGDEHFADMTASAENVRGAQQAAHALIDRYGWGPVHAAAQTLEAQTGAEISRLTGRAQPK
ncbi:MULTISPECIES: hypothetical protein [Streptomyces]|uniref:hypothetical protein n=1 Tax=Streptomyces lycopersici TaxID=2974589 RepID=UPI0021D3B9F0|nr:hypothetical protein [Streptomyces sp. NEAU-383]